MREKIFRAKAINRDKGYHRTKYKNGDWVYGLIIRLYDERFESVPAEMKDLNGVSGIEVDYKTFGQYTGLKDKNGKRIFEGDIVSVPGEDEPFIIKWEEDTAKFIIASYDIECDFDNYWGHELEIIGNIHDVG